MELPEHIRDPSDLHRVSLYAHEIRFVHFSQPDHLSVVELLL